jgi:hypothetical protein
MRPPTATHRHSSAKSTAISKTGDSPVPAGRDMKKDHYKREYTSHRSCSTTRTLGPLGSCHSDRFRRRRIDHFHACIQLVIPYSAVREYGVSDLIFIFLPWSLRSNSKYVIRLQAGAWRSVLGTLPLVRRSVCRLFSNWPCTTLNPFLHRSIDRKTHRARRNFIIYSESVDRVMRATENVTTSIGMLVVGCVDVPHITVIPFCVSRLTHAPQTY